MKHKWVTEMKTVVFNSRGSAKIIGMSELGLYHGANQRAYYFPVIIVT